MIILHNSRGCCSTGFVKYTKKKFLIQETNLDHNFDKAKDLKYLKICTEACLPSQISIRDF